MYAVALMAVNEDADAAVVSEVIRALSICAPVDNKEAVRQASSAAGVEELPGPFLDFRDQAQSLRHLPFTPVAVEHDCDIRGREAPKTTFHNNRACIARSAGVLR